MAQRTGKRSRTAPGIGLDTGHSPDSGEHARMRKCNLMLWSLVIPNPQGVSLHCSIKSMETDMKNLVARFVRDEEGQDLIEYSLLAALIAVACIAAMNTLAGNINGIFGRIGTALAGAGA